MSDIHVLTTNRKGSVSVVFHFPVPDAVNSVGVNWRLALVNSGIGTTSMPLGVGAGQITTAERDLILAGAVYEHADALPLASAGATAPQHQAALRALYATRKVEALADLQRQLKYFGHTEDEA